MGQAAGRGKLSDGHTSPDYVAGVVHFRNGVRGTYDCGAGARMCRKCLTGGGKFASAPKALRGSQRCTPAAAGAPSPETACSQVLAV